MPKIIKKLYPKIQEQQKILACRQYELEHLPLDLVQQAFPQGKWYVSYVGIEFQLPYSFPLFSEVRTFMDIQFPEWKKPNELIPNTLSGSTTYAWMIYTIYDEKHPLGSYQLEFDFNSGREGTTCVISKIGQEERMQTFPIYEITCPDGAAENVFAQEDGEEAL